MHFPKHNPVVKIKALQVINQVWREIIESKTNLDKDVT